MNKKSIFMVDGQPVNNIKEVSELLGRKVTKRDVLDGLVEGVTVSTVDIEDTTPNTPGDTTPEDNKSDTIATTHIEDASIKNLVTPAPLVPGEVTTEVKVEDAATPDINTEDNAAPESAMTKDTAAMTDEELQELALKQLEDEPTNEDEDNHDLPEGTVHCMVCKKVIEDEDDLVLTDEGHPVCVACNEAQYNKLPDTKEEVDVPENTTPDAPTDKNKVGLTLQEKLALITKPKEVKKNKGKTVKIDPTKPVEFPERGSYTDPKDLKKFYKQLTDAQLDEWLELEGLVYKASGNLSIDRMRKCMAIMDAHFPKEPGKGKKKSKYADFTTEQLVEMCMENDVEIKDAKGDMRILRMYTVMALKEAGILE
jgi:hypothetical protein